MGSSEKIIELFTQYETVLGSDRLVRENLYSAVKSLEKISRETSAVQQKIHLDGGLEKIAEIITKSDELFKLCVPFFEELSSLVPADEYYKYHDSWKSVVQRLVFAAALIHFLKNHELMTKEEVAAKLSIAGEEGKKFHLDLEDYLHGLLSLTSELSRLSVTSATVGNYKLPIAISKFVSELNSGFMLMSFKNDSLRKRYDALKYDQKKIEEVVFDLSIRGLKPTDTA